MATVKKAKTSSKSLKGIAEPTKNVSGFFIFRYTLAMTGLYAALLTPVIVGLSLKLLHVDPHHTASSLALVAGIGAFLAMFANPFFGRLSDRTISRFGRRRPWIIGGVLVSLVGLLWIALAPNVINVLLGWCLVQIAFNATLSTLTAVLADQVPVKQRGTTSGFVGIGTGIGILFGVAMAAVFGGQVFWIFMAPGFVGAAFILFFGLTIKDQVLPKSQRPAYTAAEFFRTFWANPLKHPSFGWAWISRFLLFLGLSTITTYQTLFFINRFGFTAANVTNNVFVATLISTVVLIAGSILGGILSDKLKRRKVFVLIASVLCVIALYLYATANVFGLILVAAAVVGLAQGAYLAVDLALVTQVLPNKKDTAKDLGVMNIANTLPQSVAPAIAPIFLAINGPTNYTSLFIAAAAFAVLGALAVLPIRGVK